ncbi:RNA-binding protein 8A isoform X1 [Hydra vulgaris]|uniref:RNA-binding protein 8A n=1 Tax=Hydra vulgaris TaxID=6087 RepID=T2M2E6_HYDVU|nr:RNA-binding protein 8A [Hydra vulgaris]
MSEVLDVDIDEKDEFMEQDDDGDLSKLKSSVRKRKGRGFKESLDARTNEPFESIDEDAPHIEGPQKSVEGWILFVTNVHEEAQEDDVHNMFREYGAIRNMHLNLDRRTGFLKGYALVEYESFKEAQSALEALNGEDLLGQKINVDWAFVKGGATKGNKKRGSRR